MWLVKKKIPVKQIKYTLSVYDHIERVFTKENTGNEDLFYLNLILITFSFFTLLFVCFSLFRTTSWTDDILLKLLSKVELFILRQRTVERRFVGLKYLKHVALLATPL